MKDKVYLVGYSHGSHDDYRRVTLFVTDDESFAKAYTEKLDRFSDYVTQYERDYREKAEALSEEFYELISDDRWNLIYEFSRHGLGDYNTSFYEPIELRNHNSNA